MERRALLGFLCLGLGCFVLGQSFTAQAYPTDEWERTGIRRLKWQCSACVLLASGSGSRYWWLAASCRAVMPTCFETRCLAH